MLTLSDISYLYFVDNVNGLNREVFRVFLRVLGPKRSIKFWLNKNSLLQFRDLCFREDPQSRYEIMYLAALTFILTNPLYCNKASVKDELKELYILVDKLNKIDRNIFDQYLLKSIYK